MYEEHPLKRATSDEEQCTDTSGKGGQCPYAVVEGTKFCSRHGGRAVAALNKKRRAKRYQVEFYQREMDKFSGDGNIKDLHEEIAILRVTLQGVLNRCEKNQDLLLYSHKISGLVDGISKVVQSMHKIEQSMGALMDKPAAVAFAGDIIKIIAAHVLDESILEAITDEIVQALGDDDV